MNLSDLDQFQQAIELAEANNREAAHLILERLRQTNPDNSRVLLCYVFTSDDPAQAKPALETAAQLDPLNPSVSVAQNWLALQWPGGNGHDMHLATQFKAADFVDIYRASSQPEGILSGLAQNELLSTPTLDITQPDRPIFKPAVRWWKRLLQDWQLWLGFSLLGLAGWLIISQLWPVGLTTSEKTYWQYVRTISEQTNQVNQRLQELGNPNSPTYRQDLLTQLKTLEKLNQQFRQHSSPSMRFDKLDGFLTLAYNYYSEGASKISQGLENGDQELIRQGNVSLVSGNDFLHKARQELERLGLR